MTMICDYDSHKYSDRFQIRPDLTAYQVELLSRWLFDNYGGEASIYCDGFIWCSYYTTNETLVKLIIEDYIRRL